jgi:hypothetical protein
MGAAGVATVFIVAGVLRGASGRVGRMATAILEAAIPESGVEIGGAGAVP